MQNHFVSMLSQMTFSTTSGSDRRSSARRRRKAVLFLEMVEARSLLSTFTVTSLADDNVGTGHSGDLRYVLNLANKLDTGTSVALTRLVFVVFS